MTADALVVLFDSLYLIALACWVGGVAFFLFGVGPVLSKTGETEAGDRFARALFPRYSLWSAISGAVTLPCAVAVPLCVPELRGPGVGLHSLILLASILTMLYLGNVLTPALFAARDRGENDTVRKLRLRSMVLNVFVLAVGAGLLAAFVNRTRPGKGGIVEMTPAEQTSSEANKILRDRPEALQDDRGP